MNSLEASRTMMEILDLFFSSATVVYANQSHMVKPNLPLVTMHTISSQRVSFPLERMEDGQVVSFYPSLLRVQLDLYTKGGIREETGLTPFMENTALSDMVEFSSFLGSHYFTQWSRNKDISLLQSNQVQDTTHLLNGKDYQFRATMELSFHFTERVEGYTALAHHLTQPLPLPSASGGGSRKLAEKELGYFQQAHVKQVKHETSKNKE